MTRTAWRMSTMSKACMDKGCMDKACMGKGCMGLGPEVRPLGGHFGGLVEQVVLHRGGHVGEEHLGEPLLGSLDQAQHDGLWYTILDAVLRCLEISLQQCPHVARLHSARRIGVLE